MKGERTSYIEDAHPVDLLSLLCQANQTQSKLLLSQYMPKQIIASKMYELLIKQLILVP